MLRRYERSAIFVKLNAKRICGDLARKRSTHGLVYVACSLSVVMYRVVVNVELRPRRRFEFDCVLRRFCELTPPFRREQPDSLRRIRQFIDRLFDRVVHHVRVFWDTTSDAAHGLYVGSCGRNIAIDGFSSDAIDRAHRVIERPVWTFHVTSAAA